jgi:hypothetical protein
LTQTRRPPKPKGGSISKLGLVLSRFEFNKMPNPAYHAGPFTLAIEGGISAFRAPRPQLVLLSSAGVERNAIIGEDTGAFDRVRLRLTGAWRPISLLVWCVE